MIDVFIPGVPAPQGSKRHVGNGIMVEMSKGVKPWRESIRSALITSAGQPVERFGGAVIVHCEFVMPRPKCLAKRVTPLHVKRPDRDKLKRAVNDAITSAGVICDDSADCGGACVKRYAEIGEVPGLRLRITDATADAWRALLDYAGKQDAKTPAAA